MTASIRPRWTAAETDRILDLAGDLPWPLALAAYHRWAADHGHPQRTDKALALYVQEQGGTIYAMGEWVTAGACCTAWHIKTGTMGRWLKRHRDILRPVQPTGALGRFYIRRANLRAFARQLPHLLGGIAAADLFLILEDQELSDHIATAFPRRPLSPVQKRPVRCIDTGVIYPSVRDAARAIPCSISAISQAVNGHASHALGLRWEPVEVAA
jgi:hypothetical protein